jgi:hypothetical protein
MATGYSQVLRTVQRAAFFGKKAKITLWEFPLKMLSRTTCSFGASPSDVENFEDIHTP